MLNIRNGEIVKYNNVIGRIECRKEGYMFISIYNKNMIGIDNLDILTTATDEEKLEYIMSEIENEIRNKFSVGIVEVHTIENYQFVKVTSKENKQYFVFVDFIDINKICYSLDSAILSAIAYNNDTRNFYESACKLLDIDI